MRTINVRYTLAATAKGKDVLEKRTNDLADFEVPHSMLSAFTL